MFGKIFEENELIRWIKEKHFNSAPLNDCNIEDASVDPVCLEHYARRFSFNNEIILIPVNRAFWPAANNFMCSLQRIGYNHIVFWSLDNFIHDELLKFNLLSIFLPGFPPSMSIVKAGTQHYKMIMRYKPKVIQMLLNAGLNVWYIDVDTVICKKFHLDVESDQSNSILFALDFDPAKEKFLPSTSMLFLRQNPSTSRFMKLWLQVMDKTTSIDDQQAFRRLIKDHKIVNDWKQDLSIDMDLVESGSWTNTPKNDNNSNEEIISVKALDPLKFISSHMLSTNFYLPKNFSSPTMIHTSFQTNLQDALKQLGIWFLDNNDKCEYPSVDEELKELNSKIERKKMADTAALKKEKEKKLKLLRKNN